MKLIILACSARKLPHAAQALDIYQGHIFTKGRELAERNGWWPLILSAKYGLINWDHWVEPYNQKMKGDYRGPWTLPGLPAFEESFYLGGQLYFQYAPDRIKPLVPSGTIGYMLNYMNRLLAGESRESLFK